MIDPDDVPENANWKYSSGTLAKARAASDYQNRMGFAAMANVQETWRVANETSRVADATETMAMVEYLRILADLLDRGLVSEERVLGLEKKLAERFEGVLGREA